MSERIYFDPPAEAEGDDARRIYYVPAKELVIDTTKQRDVEQARIDGMGEWDWAKAEMPTVTERADGTLAVNEGQHRVVKRQQLNPDGYIMVVRQESEADEAAVAFGITSSRRAHTAKQRWDLELESGSELQVRATAVMMNHGLHLANWRNTADPRAIAAVAGVRKVMLMPPTLEAGADLLDSVFTVLISAFPSLPRKTWEATLMKAIATLIYRNALSGKDLARLIRTLAQPDQNGTPSLTPELWVAQTAQRRPGQSPADAIMVALAHDFNRSLRKENHIQ